MTRVLVDARAAARPRRTGVGRYVWNLVRRLPEVDPETEYVAWHLPAAGNPLRPARMFGEVGSPNLVERSWPIPDRVFTAVASRLDLPRLEWLERFDVLFAPHFLPPPTRARRVVITVHDVAFRSVSGPAGVPGWPGRHLGRAIRRAARLIVPSESTRRDLAEAYGFDPGRIDVIPLGVDAAEFAEPEPHAVEAIRRRFGIDGPYLLYLGALERRKNVPGLMRAFGMLAAEPQVRLVIAGGEVPWDRPEGGRVSLALDALPVAARGRVVMTGYVSDRDRGALLAGAEALVYPSSHEGFGLPVLEAMAAGTPVLTSAVSSLPEVAGEAAVLVDPEDPEAIAAGMRALLADPDLRRRLADAGRSRAAAFTWERAARATADVLRHVAAGVGPR